MVTSSSSSATSIVFTTSRGVFVTDLDLLTEVEDADGVEADKRLAFVGRPRERERDLAEAELGVLLGVFGVFEAVRPRVADFEAERLGVFFTFEVRARAGDFDAFLADFAGDGDLDIFVFFSDDGAETALRERDVERARSFGG